MNFLVIVRAILEIQAECLRTLWHEIEGFRA